MNRDTWSLVIALADLRTYAAVCRVCTEWRGIARKIHDDGAELCPIARILTAADSAGVMVYLQEGIERRLPPKYILSRPNKFWRSWELMRRADFSIDLVSEYPNFRWCYRSLSEVSGVTTDMVIKNINKGWDFGVLLDRGLFTREMYTKYRKGRDDIVKLYKHGIITEEELIIELRKRGSLSEESATIGIRITELIPNANWDYRRLSYNPSLTLEYVIANIGKRWDFDRLLQRFR